MIGSGWGDRRGCKGQHTINGGLWAKAHDLQQAMGSAVSCGGLTAGGEGSRNWWWAVGLSACWLASLLPLYAVKIFLLDQTILHSNSSCSC